MRHCPAPRARRTANSRCRVEPRASCRLAMLAHTIASTMATAPTSSQSAARRFAPAIVSSTGSTVVANPGKSAGPSGKAAASCCPTRSRSSRAASIEVPGVQPSYRRPAARPGRKPFLTLALEPPVRRRGHEDVGELVREEEPRRQHADDRDLPRAALRRVVERERAADDVVGAAEPALPVGVTDHGDRRAIPLVLVRDEAPAKRPDAEHREQVAGDERVSRARAGAAGIIGHRRGAPRGEEGHVGQRVAPGTPVEDRGRGSRFAVQAAADVVGPHEHEAAGVAVGQGPEEHGVRDAEQRRVGADAERERQHGRERETRARAAGPVRRHADPGPASPRPPPTHRAGLRSWRIRGCPSARGRLAPPRRGSGPGGCRRRSRARGNGRARRPDRGRRRP